MFLFSVFILDAEPFIPFRGLFGK